MTINSNNNQLIIRFIDIIVNNWNNFPLIDYDNVAQHFINQYNYLIVKTKSRFEISNWPIDEHILIDEFWNNVVNATSSRTEYDVICKLIYDYYSPSAKHLDNKSINKVINLTVNNSNQCFYDIDFFAVNDCYISYEILNNIQLFFEMYKDTVNINLINRLKSRYIYPLVDIINEIIINNIINEEEI